MFIGISCQCFLRENSDRRDLVKNEKAAPSPDRQKQFAISEGGMAYAEPKILHSPMRLLSVTVTAIFITDAILMLILFRLPEMPHWIQALVDGFLLTLFLIPMLYHTLVRPMELYIGELSRTGMRLQSEIAERRQAERALLESEKDLLHLSSELLATQERERGRVSRELHEDLGQALAAVKLGLRSIYKDWRRARPEVRDEWEKNMKSIDLAIGDVRRISRALGPSIIEDFGLLAALQRHAHSLMKNSRIQVSADLMDVDCAFGQKSQMIIYRVLEEALHNVERHSGATHVQISVRQEEGHFIFQVLDDGRGFNPEQSMIRAGMQEGLGLETMVEGARMVGGKLDIQSAEGKGTTATLKVPMECKTDSVPQPGKENVQSEIGGVQHDLSSMALMEDSFDGIVAG